MREMHSSSTSKALPPRPPRVLACLQCQQRKVKCNREFPCSNCTKSRARCVPATQVPRRRRRRFSERELLDQLRKYEDLLRKHNIPFEPLHQSPVGAERSPGGLEHDAITTEKRSEGTNKNYPLTPTGYGVESEIKQVKNFWHAMRQPFVNHDDDSEDSEEDFGVVVKNAWDQTFLSDSLLIFGSRHVPVNLSSIHPEPVHVFRMWQLYLDNVEPLVKVIHVPTFQARIIDAASNIQQVDPVLEALMFSIYAMAITSITADECLAMFGSPKSDLIARYQFGCQQALLNSNFLRTSDRECLVALFLFMISVVPNTHPRALSSLLGLAVRIAQRMKLDSELNCSKHGVLEGELRRRLWWALVLFDSRICELAEYKTHTLTPSWDCKIPLNVNDTDLRPGMKEPPTPHERPTDALHAVVRGELGDFIRNTTFHLNYTAPSLTPIAKDVQNGQVPDDSEVANLEKLVDDKYFKFCDEQNPLHFFTIWHNRAYMAKCRLMESYAKSLASGLPHTEAQHKLGFSVALCILRCNTKIMTSPLTKGFQWMARLYFPFPAYIHLVHYLRNEPYSQYADQAWEAMSENCEPQFDTVFYRKIAVLHMIARFMLDGWAAREIASAQSGRPLGPVPWIVTKMRNVLLETQLEQPLSNEKGDGGIAVDLDDFPMHIPLPFGSGPEQGMCPTTEEPSNVDMNQFDWSALNWNFAPTSAWGASR